MCSPTLSDITRSTAILDHWGREWLEGQWLGCSVDRYLEIKTWEDFLAWCDENESQHNSDLAFFTRYAQEIGLDMTISDYTTAVPSTDAAVLSRRHDLVGARDGRARAGPPVNAVARAGPRGRRRHGRRGRSRFPLQPS